MNRMNISNLGPRQTGPQNIHFGILLPWVGKPHNQLFVKIIHEKDQFIEKCHPVREPMSHDVDPVYGDKWTVDINLFEHTPDSDNWGKPGRYLYRFELESILLREPLDWIVDPFAREFGPGHMSAITLDYEPHQWSSAETGWKVHDIRDLIVYELKLDEFANGLDRFRSRLPYLADLGVNAVEIMPVTNVPKTVDWGFEPIGHFGIDERYGNRKSLQEVIDESHLSGIAVILDMIYGHTGNHFAYAYVYDALNYHENPFIGKFGDLNDFGKPVDYNRKFAQDFFYTANLHWLECYHVDGIRYDCVPNYYDGTIGKGYANLVYNTYQFVKQTNGADSWGRFFVDGDIRLIQCAEQLQKPREVINHTYSNCTWQNNTLDQFKKIAAGKHDHITDLGSALAQFDYSGEVTHGNDTIRKSIFHYMENHDHPRLICYSKRKKLYKDPDLYEGDRNNWYKLQPHAIALILAQGIPMLWEGQELLEKYDVLNHGDLRIGVSRPVRWEQFYDKPGRETIRLYRNLLSLRQENSLFRRGSFCFHNHQQQWQSRGLLLYSREDEHGYALIALNFTDDDLDTVFWFPHEGNYEELLHKTENLHHVRPWTPWGISIPSNYGRVWHIKKGIEPV